MASSSTATNKPISQDPHPLKCPRCDSSNTKFCYYNNYSLSQPRHFCKACKRYWTRGGTLRNVPVGGGYRRNKRPKRHPSTAAAATDTATVQSQMNSSQNPLFYGLSTNPLELNFPFSSFRVSSDVTGFDLHPQINGLGFSSGLIHDTVSNSTSSSFSSSANGSIFFGSSSLNPYEDLHKPGKEEGGGNRFGWKPSLSKTPNPMDQINSSDPSSLLWNTTSIGAWFDPSSSSVPSLI